MKKRAAIFLFLAAILILSIYTIRYHSKNTLQIGGTTINIDIADTPAEREQGLSGRVSLPDDYGLLFVFDTPGDYGFWMKDMNFAIDIVWINAEKKIVGVENSVSPATYPNVFYPKEPVLYVLEVPAGFAKGHHIDIGSEVLLER